MCEKIKTKIKYPEHKKGKQPEYPGRTYRKTSEKGSVLVGILVGLLILSLLAVTLMTLSASAIKNAVIDREDIATYYVAESGINDVLSLIREKTEELSNQGLSHDDFFIQITNYMGNEIDSLVLDNYEITPDGQPRATINIRQIGGYTDSGEGGQSKRTVVYEIDSQGTIAERNRYLSTQIEITHTVSGTSPQIHPAFNYLTYQGSTKALNIAHNTKFDGSLYGYDIKIDPIWVDISGDIISLTNVSLGAQTNVGGNVYALGRDGKNGDVTMEPTSGFVGKNIHAKGTVKVLSNCTVAGSVYAGKDIILRGLQNSSEGIQSNAYAGRYLTIDGGPTSAGVVNISGNAYAAGKTNHYTSSNINIPYPPMAEPDLLESFSVPAPPLTDFEPGKSDKVLEWITTPQYIPPGSYKTLKSTRYGTIIRLSAGNYYFDSWDCNEYAMKLQLDVSAGPINIYVKRDIRQGGYFNVEVSEDSHVYTNIRDLLLTNPDKAKEIAGMVYTEVHRNVDFVENSSWFGTLLIKNNAKTTYNFTLVGSISLIEGKANFGTSNKFTYAPPTSSNAGSGSGSPGITPPGGAGESYSHIDVFVVKPIREK